MNKRLCIALGLLVAPGLAAAETTLYGSVRAGIDYFDMDDSGGGSGWDDFQVASQDTRFGMRGSEDIGHGLSAIYQLEFGVQLDNDNFDVDNRESWLGLQGGFGTVRVGRMVSPYQGILGQDGTSYTSPSMSFDLFEDTIGDANAIIGMNDEFHNVYSNSIRYDLPFDGDFGLSLQYVTDRDPGTVSGSEIENNDNSALSLGGTYNGDSWFAAFGIEQLSSESSVFVPDPAEPLGVRLGGGWHINDGLRAGLMYETVDGDGALALERDSYTAFLGWELGGENRRELAFAYTAADDSDLGPDTGASMFSLGYFCYPSDNTRFHAVLSTLDNDANATSFGSNAYGLGWGTDIGAELPGIAGEDQVALEFGVRYDF